MTQEIIEMAQECGLVGMRPYLDGIYIESLLAFAKRVEEKALSEHAMRETQRIGQEIEQEPVAWPCLIDSADFSENTITLVMQCEDYKVSAGTHWLSTTPPKEKK